MPRRDGTGPMGAGPMTGRGRGVCPGAPVDADRPSRGFGFGRRSFGRRGMGRGFRMRGFGPMTQEQRLQEEREGK